MDSIEKVYVTHVNDDRPLIHKIADCDKSRPYFLYTVCGERLSFRYEDVVLQYRHARQFADMCKECRDGSDTSTGN